ncbi:hypothetical protein IAG25_33075 [Caballeronia sp. EK]|uniref:hypothetical protein n=1 Tax=Caballeronia sp. EK TaxID=2767469 RepID=UPI001654EFE3|nr:hypothetical protein [Caballeronia sp. EK]MBC8641660.1 hypothetical protein [Caballeronia sp. EK]
MAMALNSLRAIADQKTLGVGKDNIFKIDPRVIKIEQGFNIRFETPRRRAYIDDMKVAFRAGATFPPLRVRAEDGEVILVDGHNRLQMYQELIEEGAEILFVLCLEFRGNEAERVSHMTATGKQGLQILALEAGHGYRRLTNWGWPVQQIATRDGVSDTYVEQCIMLAEAPIAIQQMIVREEVACHVVVDVLRKHGKRAHEVLVAGLERAKATGGKKVTTKTLNGPAIPRLVVDKVVSSLDTFYSRLSETDREQLQTVLDGNDSELEGRSITLSAASLKALLDARAEVQNVYAKADQRNQKRAARAAKEAAGADGATESDDSNEPDEEFSIDSAVADHFTQAA